MIVRILLIVLIAFCGYVGMEFFNLRQEFFKVYTAPEIYQVAAPDADLTIVEFSRYGCDHCKALHPVLMDAIKSDGKIRYIPRPVSFDDKQNARVIAAVYAAAQQGKLLEMQDKIYESAPVSDDETLFKIAKAAGLDTEKLSRDMNSAEVQKQISENEAYFKTWGLSATPTLLIGKAAIYLPRENTPSTEGLLDKFEQARAAWF